MHNWVRMRRVVMSAGLAAMAGPLTTAEAGEPTFCPPFYKKGVLNLEFNPAFLSIDEFNVGARAGPHSRHRRQKADGLVISSFFNIDPPVNTPDLVARISDLDRLRPRRFDASADVEILTDVSPQTKMVWPNSAARVPDGVLPFEGIVVPQGFQPAIRQGRLTIINLDDPARTEYVVDQSTQGPNGFTFPLDPNNSPRFYHQALFIDMDNDGLRDIVTVRSGFRVFPSVYPPFSELVYFKNPGASLQPDEEWAEVVLWGGPAAGFLGPDIHLKAHDFEGDGVPEIVATHFFSGFPTPPGAPPPSNGKISIYGAPVGQSWSVVDALAFSLPRVTDISVDQGFPFDVEIVDLNRDGRADILASNHQPDQCTPERSSAVRGRVYALQAPASGRIFEDPWSTHVLLDDVVPNPSLPGTRPPGRLAPGLASAFWPLRLFEGVVKPWIIVGGDEASRVWVLRPQDPFDSSNWAYDSAVIFDINEFYGPAASQTPNENGVTISTIGAVVVRYDRPGLSGMAEVYIPVFEGRDIHVMSFRRGRRRARIECPVDQSIQCAEP